MHAFLYSNITTSMRTFVSFGFLLFVHLLAHCSTTLGFHFKTNFMCEVFQLNTIIFFVSPAEASATSKGYFGLFLKIAGRVLSFFFLHSHASLLSNRLIYKAIIELKFWCFPPESKVIKFALSKRVTEFAIFLIY